MTERRLQINPDPLRVVAARGGEPVPYKTMRTPGVRTTDDWRVGHTFKVFGTGVPGAHPSPLLGVCVNVTPWGNDQVRWVRLRHPDGTERSYAPSQLHPPGRRTPSMAANINRVILVGNLTKDPELRHTGGGTPVCSLRVAVNSRRKDESGEWADKPNYFSVTVFGNQAEACAQYLSKGRPIAVDGRLEWREWEAKDGGGHREAVEIVADNVQFLGSRSDGDDDGGQFVPAAAAASPDDDIPF